MAFDFLMTEDNDLPLNPRLRSGREVTAQRVKLRLFTFFGEWILDRTVGIRYLQFLEQKPPNLDIIGAAIKTEVESVPEVARVVDFRTTFNVNTSTVTVTGTIIDIAGDEVILELEPFDPENLNAHPILIFFGTSGRIIT